MERVNLARILCPIDFSEFSRDALDHAIVFARYYGAEVTVMHVVEGPVMPGLPVEGGLVVDPISPDDVEAEVRRFVEPAVGKADIRFHTEVATGNPVVEIERHAARLRADLVVLGTHGRSGFKRLLLGSVTERLMRTMQVPLLIVPAPVKHPESIGYDTILCPVDFSPESMRALDYALSLAQEADGRIVLLHSLEGLLDELDPQELRNVSLFDYLTGLETDMTERLVAAIPEEARLWSRPKHRIARGRAYRQILAVAEEERASLIVMGVRGRGAVNRLIFGSTTEHVIREAKCPVLTLHAEAPVGGQGPAASTAKDGVNG